MARWVNAAVPGKVRHPALFAPVLKAGRVDSQMRTPGQFTCHLCGRAATRQEGINSLQHCWFAGKSWGKDNMIVFGKKYYTPLAFNHLAYGH